MNFLNKMCPPVGVSPIFSIFSLFPGWGEREEASEQGPVFLLKNRGRGRGFRGGGAGGGRAPWECLRGGGGGGLIFFSGSEMPTKEREREKKKHSMHCNRMEREALAQVARILHLHLQLGAPTTTVV